MNEIIVYSLVLVFAVFIASCSQILLKLEASKPHKHRIAEYLNWRVLIAYGLFAVTVSVSMYLLRYIPLSLTFILESTSYIFVTILSRYILAEKISKVQFLGMALIIAGVILFSI